MHIPEFIKTYGFFLLLIMGSFYVAAQFIGPAPQKHVVIAAGSKGGAYYKYAEQYSEKLKANGIDSKILDTKGASENVGLLKDKKADIAFIQGGIIENGFIQDEIEVLGSIYFEPLWVFIHKEETEILKDLRALKGKIIAVGKEGGGTKEVASKILSINGITPDNTTWVYDEPKLAYKKLIDKNIDTVFLIGGYESPIIDQMLNDDQLKLLSIRRSEAYTREFHFLSTIKLPEGIISFEKNIPDSEVKLISPVAMLGVRGEFHSALKTLLIQTAQEIHLNTGPYINNSQFPSQNFVDIKLSDEALRFYKYGPSLLQRYLPFWLADLIDRLKIMLIPLIGVMLPLFKLAPPAYRWRIRSKIYKWYKTLKKMEESISGKVTSKEASKIILKLDQIEHEARNTPVPLSYAEELYNLRMHIQLVREKFQK
jgi:TRAP transporter TAXI family solute receptor